MATWGATYHIHVSTRSTGQGRRHDIHVNRTRWQGGRPTVSGSVASLRMGELTIDAGTPLEQAIACCRAALAALEAEQAQAELDVHA